MHRLFSTPRSSTGLVLRLGLAVVMFPHGAQKVLGWFGGQGLAAHMEGFTAMGLPRAVGLAVAAAEFLGPIGLVLGLMTRLCALGIGCVMIGAIQLVHYPNGFFMNWHGQQAGEGYEYHLLALTIALALVVHGAGALSLDRTLARRRGHS